MKKEFTKAQMVALIDAMNDRPIAFNRHYVGLGCGINGALMLSQMMYWSKRTNDRNGYFYKTQEDWELETGLTRREQETARKRLKQLGFVTEHKHGVPCKVHFKVEHDALYDALLDYAQKRHSSMAESAKLKCSNPPNCDGEIRQTNTENTTKNTSEITSKKKANFSKKEVSKAVSHDSELNLNLSDKQIDYFGNLLANNPNFGSMYANVGEPGADFAKRIKKLMKDPAWVAKHIADLRAVGFGGVV